MESWEKQNPQRRGEYDAEYFRRWLLSITFKRYFIKMTKDLKINTFNINKEVRIQEVTKEKIKKDVHRRKTSEKENVYVRPSFKYLLPKPIYTKKV